MNTWSLELGRSEQSVSMLEQRTHLVRDKVRQSLMPQSIAQAMLLNAAKPYLQFGNEAKCTWSAASWFAGCGLAQKLELAKRGMQCTREFFCSAGAPDRTLPGCPL